MCFLSELGSFLFLWHVFSQTRSDPSEPWENIYFNGESKTTDMSLCLKRPTRVGCSIMKAVKRKYSKENFLLWVETAKVLITHWQCALGHLHCLAPRYQQPRHNPSVHFECGLWLYTSCFSSDFEHAWLACWLTGEDGSWRTYSLMPSSGKLTIPTFHEKGKRK